MKPHRWYHDLPGMTRLHIIRCQARVYWEHFRPSWKWLVDRDPSERRAVAPDRRGKARYGPDVLVTHYAGQSDAEIISRLLADLFPARAK